MHAASAAALCSTCACVALYSAGPGQDAAGAGAGLDSSQAGPRGGWVPFRAGTDSWLCLPLSSPFQPACSTACPPCCCLQGRPAVRKAVVVTPSSLTQNWSEEARKWLGDERMRVMVLSSGPEGKQQARELRGAGPGAGSRQARGAGRQQGGTPRNARHAAKTALAAHDWLASATTQRQPNSHQPCSACATPAI